MKKIKVDLVAVIAGLILLVLFVMAAFQSGADQAKALGDCEYEVILPEGYQNSGENYPVIYVLPRDGMNMDDGGLSEKLVTAMDEGFGTQMIIVQMSFAEDSDVAETMETLAGAIDNSYRTIPDKGCRVLAGTDTGGYLAYAIGLNYEGTFSSLVSVRGDFVSENNPWYCRISR